MIGLPIAALYFGLFSASWVPHWLKLSAVRPEQRGRYFIATYLGIAAVVPLLYFGGEYLARQDALLAREWILLPIVPLFFAAKWLALRALRVV